MKGSFCRLWLGLKLGSLNNQAFSPSDFVCLFLNECYDILVFSLSFLLFFQVKKFKLEYSLTKSVAIRNK